MTLEPQPEERGRLPRLDVEVLDVAVGLGLLQLLAEVGRALVREPGLVLLAVDLRDGDDVVLRPQVNRLDDVRLVELRDELTVGGRRRLVARADELLGEEGQHHHDQDGEGGALEEPAHRRCAGGFRIVRKALRVSGRSSRPDGLRESSADGCPG
jgi:hypothetical protein